MPGNHKWTPQDDEDLIRLADSGFCLETIAEVLGWSLGATRGHLALLRQAAPTTHEARLDASHASIP